MAIQTNGTNVDYFRLADDAALTLPDSEWTIAGWINIKSNPVGFAYIVSWGTFGAQPSFNLYRNNGDNGALHSEDSGAATIAITSAFTGACAAAKFGDWQHLTTKRTTGASSATIETFLDGVSDGSGTNANYDAVDQTAEFTFGARTDLSSATRSNTAFDQWAKWDRALTDEEIAALAAGMHPRIVRPSSMAWHVDCSGSVPAADSIAGISINSFGMTVVEGPKIIYPWAPYAIRGQGAAPPAGGRPQGPFGHPFSGVFGGPV